MKIRALTIEEAAARKKAASKAEKTVAKAKKTKKAAAKKPAAKKKTAAKRPAGHAGMTVKELRALAKKRKIPGYHDMRKADLVKAIEKSYVKKNKKKPAAKDAKAPGKKATSPKKIKQVEQPASAEAPDPTSAEKAPVAIHVLNTLRAVGEDALRDALTKLDKKQMLALDVGQVQKLPKAAADWPEEAVREHLLANAQHYHQSSSAAAGATGKRLTHAKNGALIGVAETTRKRANSLLKEAAPK